MYGRRFLIVAVAAALTSCTPLVSGSRDYRTAGARSAGDASSQVASAAQVAQLAIAGRAFGPYLAVVVGDAEGALGGIESTFGALQPPTRDDEVTREEVLDTLGNAVNQVSELRVTVEASRAPTPEQLAALAALRDDLDELAGELA